MKLSIKQLEQHGQIFVPQTTSEAVLVNTGGTTERLDTVLDRKIENIITPAGSGLQSLKSGKSVYVTHPNQITPNDQLSSVIIKYDGRGHIVETAPAGKMTIIVDNKGYTQYDGSQDRALMFGNDFETDENNIILKWNHL